MSSHDDICALGITTHTIHGAGIFTYIYHKHQPFIVGKYTSPMDGMGAMPWIFEKTLQGTIVNISQLLRVFSRRNIMDSKVPKKNW